MKLGLWTLIVCLGISSPAAIAAEYQGQSIDGQRFYGTAYSYESGGTFDVEVEFDRKWATLYFVNGGRQQIRLKRESIQDLRRIHGWGSHRLLRFGGIFSVGLARSLDGNREWPEPLHGYWMVSLHQEASESD